MCFLEIGINAFIHIEAACEPDTKEDHHDGDIRKERHRFHLPRDEHGTESIAPLGAPRPLYTALAGISRIWLSIERGSEGFPMGRKDKIRNLQHHPVWTVYKRSDGHFYQKVAHEACPCRTARQLETVDGHGLRKELRS
jgi:hypothetical protein